jgi:hypothetical protein
MMFWQLISLRLFVRIVFSILALCFSETAKADQDGLVDGNMLLQMCSNPSDVTQAFCSGYVVGLLEGHKFGAFLMYGHAVGESLETDRGNEIVETSLGFCIPSNVEYGQIVDAFVRFLDQAVEARHETARSLFVSAMGEAYPCG